MPTKRKWAPNSSTADLQFPLLLIGGLSGRVDQTVHTMTVLHKLRKSRHYAYVLSGESLAWVLDAGSHEIHIDHNTMGQTCGILPIGIDGAHVRTRGLEWNLGEHMCVFSKGNQADSTSDWHTCFDGEVSTSNHLLPSEPIVTVETDAPVLWCVEVRDASV